MRAVADAAGNIVKETAYDSFGNILSDSAPAFTIPLGFAGGLHDRDTGLVRFGFRDYDPDTGTWTAKDLLGFAAGGIDFYAYCSSDPIAQFDPLGLDALGRVKAAERWLGSYNYGYNAFHDTRFRRKTWKCNEFVHDVITEAGDTCPMKGPWYRKFPPSAGDWGNSKLKIPGWDVVTDPKPGDIVGVKRDYVDATGHCGVVIAVWLENGVTTGITMYASERLVTIGDFGFRQNENNVYRRPSVEITR